MIYFKPSIDIAVENWTNDPDILREIDVSVLKERFTGFKSKAAYPIIANDTEGYFLFVDEHKEIYLYGAIAGSLRSIEEKLTIAEIVNKLHNHHSLKIKLIR